ncbi:SGNH/GDSL hydrolase family protein [Limnohabitans radicicola]|uniref:SGNH/GDSL hydrolase family protein n=1 Tax=Limnohabitans radicicola TaxID=2771427 RepID=A0A927FGP1_9BURK|nr:SGNH/GDSL hydrolase family protein [Limnohabitans radicicola]MBD8049723.1 SGNH/GDSL hydrolase family protein [Limnohabitans radicicola]
MNSTKKALFIVIGMSMSLLAGLVLLEIIFGQWFRPDPWVATRQLNIIRQQSITYNVQNIQGHSSPTVFYSRDAFGLRGTCARPQDIDILTIGGSTTDQRLISDGQTWQDILQAEIKQQLKKSVCVSNAGVDGHSTFGHLQAFRQWFPLIEGLNPKLYVLYIGINDAGIRLTPRDAFDTFNPDDRSIPSKSLWDKSAIHQVFLLLRSMKTSHSGSSIAAYAGHAKRPPLLSEYTATRYSSDIDALIEKNTALFSRRLNALIDEVVLRKGTVVCVSQPHLFTKMVQGQLRGVENAFDFEGRIYNGLDYEKSIHHLNQAMREVCSRRQGFFVDMASNDFLTADFYDFVHNTPEGAVRLGKYFFREFNRIHLFDAL